MHIVCPLFYMCIYALYFIEIKPQNLVIYLLLKGVGKKEKLAEGLKLGTEGLREGIKPPSNAVPF